MSDTPQGPGWYQASDGKFYPPESLNQGSVQYCRNCGKTVAQGSAVCVGCGFTPNAGTSYCGACGAPTAPGQAACTSCGFSLAHAVGGGIKPAKDKTVAGILAILLGSLGIHKFYLGYNTAGIIMLVAWLACFCCGMFLIIPYLACFAIWVVGIIEGVMYLTKSDEEFNQIYVQGSREWF